MEVSLVAPRNGVPSIVVTLAGIVMVVSAVASLKAFCPMVFSLLPRANVTVLSAVASLKAHSPIDVTLAGIVILVRAV